MDSKKVMMVVDDKRINRAALSNIFEEDFDIVECANGNETINYLQSDYQKPRIILLDIVMPECDGYEVLKYLKKSGNDNIPVVLITANDDFDEGNSEFEIRVADFIHKPFDEYVVKYRIEHVLETYQSGF